MSVPVISSNVQMSDVNPDMANFINSLKASGMQVVENSSDKTFSVTLPSSSIDEKLMKSAKPMENVLKVVDCDGKMSLITTGVAETQDVNIRNITSSLSNVQSDK